MQSYKVKNMNMDKVFSVKGVTSNLDVYQDKIVITEKRGFWFWFTCIILTCCTLIGGLIFYFGYEAHKEKTIFIKYLKSIELKKPSLLRNGFIEFNLDDSNNHFLSWGSENTVAFCSDADYATCYNIRDFIERKVM